MTPDRAIDLALMQWRAALAVHALHGDEGAQAVLDDVRKRESVYRGVLLGVVLECVPPADVDAPIPYKLAADGGTR